MTSSPLKQSSTSQLHDTRLPTHRSIDGDDHGGEMIMISYDHDLDDDA